jgi:hypothetical protein
MYLGFPSHQIYFDLIGLGLLLTIVCCFFGLFVYSLRGKPSVMIALACAMLVLGVVQIYRGKMVPDDAWLVMLGAIETAPASERAERVNDLRAHWQARTMRAVDWYRLSRKWNVCHALWVEEACTRPAVSERGVGIARERLDTMANTNVSYALNVRGYSSLPRYELRSHAPDTGEPRHRLEITDLFTGSTSTILRFDQRAETRWSPEDRYLAITRMNDTDGSNVLIYEPATSQLIGMPWPEAVGRMDLEYGRATMHAIGWVEPDALWVDVFASDGMGKTFHAKVIHRMPDSH